MNIKLLKSSTVIIETNGIKILNDPWLIDGEYYGSWAHYPAYEYDNNDFNDIDYIYISHIHPDHLSKKTLCKLNKTIPVLIHSYESKFLKFNIERLGFKVIELPNNKRTHLKNNVFINILAADNCNPELCQRFFGCGKIETKFGSTQIDSLSVIDDGNYSVLNLNDCPFELGIEALKEVKKQYKSIDFMLVGYGGAGPYPQCFDNLSDIEKKQEARKKEIKFLNQAYNYIKFIQPKFYMPFAGTYVLAGSLVELTKFRGVPELIEAQNYLQKQNYYLDSPPQCILLNSKESFSLSNEISSKKYTPVNKLEKHKYLTNTLSKRKFDFDQDKEPSIQDFMALIPKAFQRLEAKRLEINFKSDTEVFIELINDKFISISFNGNGYKIIDSQYIKNVKSFVSYKLNPKLLFRILKGPKFAHWDNASVGSHIQFNRKPNIFERGLYYSMNFFHC